jgi:hypothetical protein
LKGNKLSAMHPRMFAHLTKLKVLLLSGNSCINKNFDPVTSLAAIEQQLGACGAEYALTELENLQNRHERKFELLTELFYNVDERNEENAAEIKEIKKTVDKIWDMLNTK